MGPGATVGVRADVGLRGEVADGVVGEGLADQHRVGGGVDAVVDGGPGQPVQGVVAEGLAAVPDALREPGSIGSIESDPFDSLLIPPVKSKCAPFSPPPFLLLTVRQEGRFHWLTFAIRNSRILSIKAML